MGAVQTKSVRTSGFSSPDIELTDFSADRGRGTPNASNTHSMRQEHSEEQALALRNAQRRQSLNARERLFGQRGSGDVEEQRILPDHSFVDEPEHEDDLGSNASCAASEARDVPSNSGVQKFTPIRMKSSDDAKALGLSSGGAMSMNLMIAEKLEQKRTLSGSEPKIRNCFVVSQVDGKYFMQKSEGSEPKLADGHYIFVTSLDGTIRLGNSAEGGNNAHATLSGNSLYVRYAGEVEFKNGELQWFTNQSGTYLPEADLHAQSGFDKDKFRPLTH